MLEPLLARHAGSQEAVHANDEYLSDDNTDANVSSKFPIVSKSLSEYVSARRFARSRKLILASKLRIKPTTKCKSQSATTGAPAAIVVATTPARKNTTTNINTSQQLELRPSALSFAQVLNCGLARETTQGTQIPTSNQQRLEARKCIYNRRVGCDESQSRSLGKTQVRSTLLQLLGFAVVQPDRDSSTSLGTSEYHHRASKLDLIFRLAKKPSINALMFSLWIVSLLTVFYAISFFEQINMSSQDTGNVSKSLVTRRAFDSFVVNAKNSSTINKQQEKVVPDIQLLKHSTNSDDIDDDDDDASRTILVNTKCGPCIGSVIKVGNKGSKVNVFRNIPYAQQPINNLRFRKARKLAFESDFCKKQTSHSNNNPNYAINSKSKNNSCAQISPISRLISGTEDCLYLDIYSPTVLPSSDIDINVKEHDKMHSTVTTNGTDKLEISDSLVSNEL